MVFFQSVKKPVVQAGKEMIFAVISLYASSKAVLWAAEHVKIESAKDVVVMETIGKGLPVACYMGLSKLTRASLIPPFHRRPPLPIPQAIAAAALAFVISPFGQILFCSDMNQKLVEFWQAYRKIDPFWQVKPRLRRRIEALREELNAPPKIR